MFPTELLPFLECNEFMFEREANFTGLLIPANLLADDHPPRAKVLNGNLRRCRGDRLALPVLHLGLERRGFAGFKKSKKAGAEEIPRCNTAFHTTLDRPLPGDNPLGRLWMLNRPDSSLAQQMDFITSPRLTMRPTSGRLVLRN